MLPEFNFASSSIQKIANSDMTSQRKNAKLYLGESIMLMLSCDQFSNGLFKPIEQDQLKG